MKHTVSDLRKALKGLKGNMPVYIADHDHGPGETNGCLGHVFTENQKDLGEEWNNKQYNEIYKIKGKYLVLKVG